MKGDLMPQVGRGPGGGVDAFTTRQLKLVCCLEWDQKGCDAPRIPQEGLYEKLLIGCSPAESWHKRLTIPGEKTWGSINPDRQKVGII